MQHARGPRAEFGLTISELTAMQAKKITDQQSEKQRMTSYRFDRRANQETGKAQQMGGRGSAIAVQNALRGTATRRDVG
jgi:hypothetical protein